MLLPNRSAARLRLFALATLVPLGGCPDLSTICPYKVITQGVFGEVVDASNVNEENVEVDMWTILNGQKDMMFATIMTNRAGYEFHVDPSMYMICAKNVCSTITVPTGLVESSAIDAASGLKWDEPVAVPPAEMIGACKYGE